MQRVNFVPAPLVSTLNTSELFRYLLTYPLQASLVRRTLEAMRMQSNRVPR